MQHSSVQYNASVAKNSTNTYIIYIYIYTHTTISAASSTWYVFLNLATVQCCDSLDAGEPVISENALFGPPSKPEARGMKGYFGLLVRGVVRASYAVTNL